jgi:hypothetical protein
MTFTDEDVKMLKEFGAILHKGEYTLGIADIIKFHKYLVAYNKIVGKVEAHVMEVVSLKEPEASNGV